MRTKFLMALCRLYFLNFHWMPLQSTNYYQKFQGSISGDNTIPFALPTQWSNVDKWIAFVCHMMFFIICYLFRSRKKNVSKELIKLKLKWNTGWKCSCSNNSMITRISWEPFIIWILYYLSVKLIWENKFLFCCHNDFGYYTINYQKSYSHWEKKN